jgi:hypothetical protein
MELLIAFLIAFGLITENSRAAKTMTESDAKELIAKNNLEKDYIIFGQEHDDF